MWLPCEVKPGPFSDERMVLVKGDDSEWFGFVNVRWLRKDRTGPNEVLAKVVDVEWPSYRARIPGFAPKSGLFQGRIEGKLVRVAPD